MANNTREEEKYAQARKRLNKLLEQYPKVSHFSKSEVRFAVRILKRPNVESSGSGKCQTG